MFVWVVCFGFVHLLIWKTLPQPNVRERMQQPWLLRSPSELKSPDLCDEQ